MQYVAEQKLNSVPSCMSTFIELRNITKYKIKYVIYLRTLINSRNCYHGFQEQPPER